MDCPGYEVSPFIDKRMCCFNDFIPINNHSWAHGMRQLAYEEKTYELVDQLAA
jgi:hypothetical protein